MNYTLKVANVRCETEDTITLCFKQPGLKKIKYLAGQYLTLIFRINGRRYLRPYSFSSAPEIDSMLEITVKRVLNGIVSNHIHDCIKIGDSIEVMSPLGDFIYVPTQNIKTVYLWGTGSGITPLISLAKSILYTEDQVKVRLLYGNRNVKSTIFIKQIQQLENLYSSRFDVKHFHTQLVVDELIPSHVQGRINEERALEILNDDKSLQESVHYICGPSGLKESVKNALQITKVDPANILSEEFELVKDPKDFEDILTRSIKLNFNGNDYDLEVVKGKSILEAALDSNIELPYSCQTGNCSTCLGKLIDGEAKVIGLSKMRDDLEQDEYLLCCTHPVTDNVYFKI